MLALWEHIRPQANKHAKNIIQTARRDNIRLLWAQPFSPMSVQRTGVQQAFAGGPCAMNIIDRIPQPPKARKANAQYGAWQGTESPQRSSDAIHLTDGDVSNMM